MNEKKKYIAKLRALYRQYKKEYEMLPKDVDQVTKLIIKAKAVAIKEAIDELKD